MKRKFTFLMAAVALLCFMLPAMTGWGQTAVDVTLSTGSFNNNVITWTCADGNITIKQLKGTGSSNPNSSYISAPRVYKQNILSFVGNNGYTITNIDIKCDGSYYGSTKYAGTEISSDDNNVYNNTGALNPTWSTANGGTHTIATVSNDGLSEIYIQNGHSSDASTQLRITKITITYKVSGSIKATTVTINTSGLTNTDVYTSTSAGILSASVTETETGDAISGATVTWSSSATDVATIGNDGVVTLVAVGTTTITASYAGESGVYGTSSATYELTVTSTEPYVQPTTIEITPNYAFWGKTGQFSGNTYDELEGSKDNVSLNWARGDGSTYANTTAMRFYKDNNLTFTAPVGFEIKSIVITFTAVQSDLAFSPEGYSLTESTGTWTGSSATVIMSRPTNATSYATISKFTITIGSPSSAVATTTTINVPTGFNTDIYQGTVAGTLTATVKDNDDNTVSEATVTWESTDTDVATITDAGDVTLVATGTTTIKAIYAGVTDQYQASTGTYELTVTNSDPNAPGTENNPYTVVQAIANTPASGTSSNVYIHGIVSAFQNTSIVGDGSSYRYYISDDGTTTNQLLVYKGKGLNNVAFSNADDLLVGDEVTILGGLTMYNSTPEVASGNYLTSWNRPASTTPSITLSSYSIEATAAETEGTLTVTYTNITDVAAEVVFYAADGETPATYEWMDADIDANNNVYYTISDNTGAARTAYFKVHALDDESNDVYSNLVTVTQAAPVVDYATLPFTWNNTTIPSGVTMNNVGTYSNSPNLKFNNSNDSDEGNVILKLNAAPGAIVFDMKANPGSGSTSTGTFTVSTSANGEAYTTLATYTSIINTPQTICLTNISSDVRYIKWSYVKTSGNVAIGNFIVTKAMDAVESGATWTVGDFTPAENHSYIIENNSTLTLSGDFSSIIDEPYYIIVEDGGQLIHTDAVQATLKKSINAYTEGQKDGWYTIASPVAAANIGIATTGTYDLYRYDEENVLWLNQELAANSDLFTGFNQGIGYLYGNAAGVELQFAGAMVGTNSTINVPLSWSSTNANLKGFNLVGNPFTRNLVAGDVNIIDAALTSYYYVAGGDELTSALISERPIKPGEGFFVQTSAAGNLVLNPSSKGGRGMDKPSYVRIETGNESYMDQAYIQIGQGNTLNKMTINDNVAHVSVQNDNAEYAVATIEAARGEMPVNFKAAENGTYTINVATENLDADYLHLIDNLTGTDVDLLATPSYTFESRKNDYASRFRLRFSANNNNSVSDEFAFVSNGEIVIMNEGEATLQVIDMLGRTVSTQAVDGNARIDKMSANGVYVLRLIDGNEVKTQKIVIE